jgi:macrodomain Ter protein organizer (MatP/YcbG family)
MRAVCISDDYKRKFTNNPCVCITINYLQKRRDHITNITEQKLLAKLFEIDTLLVNARFDTEDGRLNYKSVDLELKVYDRLVEQMNNIKGGSVLAKENINIFISKREDDNKTIDTEHIDIAEDDDGY